MKIKDGYVNKNGNLTEDELLELKKLSKEEFRARINHLARTAWKYPPNKYRTVDCFYCMDY